jgi:hypothetical protein
VDTVAPSAPVIDSPANNSYDTDGSFAVKGTAEANSMVELFEGTSSRGKATADASGNWSVALSGVSEGSHTYTAKATAATGNASTASNALTVIVDKSAPTLGSVTPLEDATRVSRATNVTATFSEAMDKQTLVTDRANQTSTTVELFRADSTTTPIAAKVTLSSDGKTLTLDPSVSLSRRTKYEVRIKGGASGAKDLAGNPLAADKVWSFTTGRR